MTEPQLTYYPLGEGVTAFSTTRHGGFSRGNYGEFNVNRYCGDAPEAIRQNRRLLSLKLGVTDDRIVMPHQVHGVQIPSMRLSVRCMQAGAAPSSASPVRPCWL